MKEENERKPSKESIIRDKILELLKGQTYERCQSILRMTKDSLEYKSVVE